MADERVAYAGDLGSDCLGKTVEVPGRDQPWVLIEVVHWKDGDLLKTTLWDQSRQAHTLDCDQLVRVLP